MTVEVRVVGIDSPDAAALVEAVQREYESRYGGRDATPVQPEEFAAPRGLFLVLYLHGVAVGCGGIRMVDPAEPPKGENEVELKRMYVSPEARGRGLARFLLAELERAGRALGARAVRLETGVLQPEAIGLYVSSGYTPIGGFGVYAQEPSSRCFGKSLDPTDGTAPPPDVGSGAVPVCP